MILTRFYEAVMARLQEMDIEFEYFDIWNDQISRNVDQEDNLFFNYPAIFIHMHPIEWESLGRRKKHGILNFELFVASEVAHETANIESPEERGRGLEHLQLVESCGAILQGFNMEYEDGSGIGSISNVGVAFDHESGGSLLFVHAIPFKTRLVDVSAVKTMVKRNPDFCNNPGLVDAGE